MRTILIVLWLATIASPSLALTITGAKIDGPSVQVKGKDAVPSAPITWEGTVVGKASKSGTFRFATSDVPSDCVGEVGDGSSTVPAVVASCAPRDRGLVVVDAHGRVLGPFLEDPGNLTIDSVAFASPDGAVLAPFQPNGFTTPPDAFVYESTDCSGPPLLRTDPSGPLLRTVALRDGVLYYPPRTGTSVTLGSFATAVANATECATPGRVFTPPDRCCCTGPVCAFAQPAEAAPPGTIDVGDFTPPFRVELR